MSEEREMSEIELMEEENEARLRIQLTRDKLLEFNNSDEFQKVLEEYTIALTNLHNIQFNQELLPLHKRLDYLIGQQNKTFKELRELSGELIEQLTKNIEQQDKNLEEISKKMKQLNQS